MGKDREVGRKGVGRHIQRAGQFSGGQARGFVTHQEPEALQPRGLGKGGQGADGIIIFHYSGIMELIAGRKVDHAQAWTQSCGPS